MPTFLVIQLARFGDLVQTKRLIRTLCARGETHLCVDAGLRDLAALLYPEAVIHAIPVHGGLTTQAVEGVRHATKALAGLRFDAV